MGDRRNTFESLSLLAAHEQWCRKLFCTTCGHMVFRWALKAIIKGHHPDEPHWPVHWGKGYTSTKLATLNGPLPPAGNWPISEQQTIQNTVVGSNIKNLNNSVRTPDWLGYLGIILYYTEEAEAQNPIVTQELTPQLLELLSGNSEVGRIPGQNQIGSTPLRWKNLEILEHFITA